MHQTKKGNQWHFGMTAHIGVNCETGIVHSMTATAANVHDITEAHNLLHGGETVVWSGAGYQGREENLGLDVDWRVAMLPGKRRGLDPGSPDALVDRAKASVRAKVAHPFLRVQRLFGYSKVRYRGLAKNVERLALLFGLGNLLAAEGRLRGSAPGGVLGRAAGRDKAHNGPIEGLNAIVQMPAGKFLMAKLAHPRAGQTQFMSMGLVQSVPRIHTPEPPCQEADHDHQSANITPTPGPAGARDRGHDQLPAPRQEREPPPPHVVPRQPRNHYR